MTRTTLPTLALVLAAGLALGADGLAASGDALAQRGRTGGSATSSPGTPSRSQPVQSRPAPSRPSPSPAPSRPSYSPPSRPSSAPPSRPSVQTPSRPSVSPPTRYGSPAPSAGSSRGSVSHGVQPPVRYTQPRSSQPRTDTSQRGAPAVPDLDRGSLGRGRAEVPQSSSRDARLPDSATRFESAPRRAPFPRLSSPPDLPSTRSRSGPSAERLSSAEAARLRAARAGERAPAPALDDRGLLERYQGLSPSARASAAERLGAPRAGESVAPSEARLGDRPAAERGGRDRAARGAQRQPLAPTSASSDELVRRREAAFPQVESTDARARLARAAERTEAFRRAAAADSPRYREALRNGKSVARATDVAIGIGAGIAGCWYPGYYGHGWYGNHHGWWFWWSWGCYPYSWYSHPFGWCYWWWWGYPAYHIAYWYPYPYYAYAYPTVYYPTAIYNYYYDSTGGSYGSYGDTVPAEPAAQVAPVGEAVAPARSAPRSASDSAASQYLSLGDQAFREQRYADAVHFYAKAVELAPDQGVLYLVLSDGLFATGDYHYGAYALRKALELDPSLARNVVDKHEFYGDPFDFDRQLAVLERFVADHPGDQDATLMLAANYLFGARPAAAVDLLESDISATLRDHDAALLLLQSAREQQHGTQAR